MRFPPPQHCASGRSPPSDDDPQITTWSRHLFHQRRGGHALIRLATSPSLHGHAPTSCAAAFHDEHSGARDVDEVAGQARGGPDRRASASPGSRAEGGLARGERADDLVAVSYTHLTLPTILLV